MFTIASKEFRSLFYSPLAWSILAICEFILAYLFLGQVELFLQLQSQLSAMQRSPGVTEFVAVPVFANSSVILLLVVPLLTMRLISEERRAQTISLLFSAPVSMLDIVLGKFLGIMFFLLLMVGLIVLMPLSLYLGSNLDIGLLFVALIGLILMLASFTALGLYVSTIFGQPTVAAVVTFGVLILLWIVEWAGGFFESAKPVFEYISMLSHYQSLLQGVFKLSDVVYYLLLILTFLILSYRRLDADRLQV
jgi:ABC-2 type transport system permease protein